MRYRIKDPKRRNAAVEIFGDIVNELPPGDNASLSLDVPGATMHPLTAELDLEPVPDNAPWKPFEPGTLKPFTRYFIVYRDTATGIIKEEARVTYEDGTFYGPEYEVLGWMEIPKWKE